VQQRRSLSVHIAAAQRARAFFFAFVFTDGAFVTRLSGGSSCVNAWSLAGIALLQRGPRGHHVQLMPLHIHVLTCGIRE
jgi:hypothetical protein